MFYPGSMVHQCVNLKLRTKQFQSILSTLSSLQRLGENNIEYEPYLAIINPYYILTFLCTFIAIIQLQYWQKCKSGIWWDYSHQSWAIYTQCIFMALEVLNPTWISVLVRFDASQQTSWQQNTTLNYVFSSFTCWNSVRSDFYSKFIHSHHCTVVCG